MSFKLFCGCSALALTALGGTTAVAADGGMIAPGMIAGYIEAHGGWERGSSTDYNPTPNGTGTWSDYQVGGSGRAAVAIVPNWSAQGDVWTGVAIAPDGSTGVDSAIGGHLTWHSADGATMLGALGSLGVGGSDSGSVGNVGLEAAVNAGRWRLYAQTGMTSGLSGDASSSGERDIYGTLSVNYFVTPNFFLSGNIGTDKWTQSNGDSSPEMSWGAKAEFKPAASPVSFFAAYEGFGFRSNYGGASNYDQGVDNIFLVGARVPLGVKSLQDLQRAVGLADLNPSFGDLLNR